MRAQYGAPLVASSPAAALALADDLARLIDDMTTRQVSWDRLDGLVPDHIDEYWQLTLKFLRIARQAWPAILSERGAIEPAARRDRLIAAEAARLAQAKGPVIAAGSTGSMPATATLLATIARLPHGAVVLPGLDTDLDEESWELIGAKDEPAFGHPQFAMHALLRRLGTARAAVTVLGEASPWPRAARVRSHASGGRDRTLAGAVCRCRSSPPISPLPQAQSASSKRPTPRKRRSPSLSRCARRWKRRRRALRWSRPTGRSPVACLLRSRAGRVPVDDSGGDVLADTPAGVFARLAAEAALGGLPPVTLLALIKHPLLRLGRRAGGHERAIAALERAVLRGPRPRPGTAGLAQALATLRQDRKNLHPADHRVALADWELEAASDFVTQLKAALAPLESLGHQVRPFAEIAACHREVIAELSDSVAMAGADGVALARGIRRHCGACRAPRFRLGAVRLRELFQATITNMVRRPILAARVRILGPLEARLQSFDRVVLGGMVEGTWPPEARGDPWLSRPMRLELGLDLPERRIGLSAA